MVARPLLVIIGPTASGKSALAMELAIKLDGEIICADSRTVYKGMNIGTAKPSNNDQKRVPHHLLDVVEPDQDFTVADFKRLAVESIEDISRRGKLPIMVGGSGLYIDAVLYDYKFSVVGAARDEQNSRHLSKAEPSKRSKLRPYTLVIGLEVARDTLKERISDRVEQMVAAGFIEETRQLQADYPISKALLSTSYKAFLEYINGRVILEEAKALFIRNDCQLAKRQMTWFKRNPSIHWLKRPSRYVEETTTLLNKLQ
ncbi:tRNA dimethylallyltransferase [Candidatus Saccharibacteria bacterium]|nr:tRNA dimethylallyltransferase [Candidatus Saccharibacteria bacterium]